MKKKLLFLLLTIFSITFVSNVSAEEINYEFKLNGWDISSFRQNVPTSSNGSQNYLNIKTTNLVDITSVPQYGYISLCASGGKISYYDSNQLSNVQVINSNNECYNFNSATAGHVVYFIFEMPMNSVWNCSASGGNCYINDNSYVVWSEYFGATYSLYGFGFGNTRFEFDNSSASIINKGNEIINEVQAGNQAVIDNQNQNQQQTNDRLDDIINSDISDSDKELPDDSAYNDYSDLEGSLLDKVNDADTSSLDISIDTNSSNFVWDTLTSFIQSHSLIFATFIAILSIGVIKLALGR